MTENILLCDMGGTHARFAKFESMGHYAQFKKYRLNAFSSFDAIITKYLDDTKAQFATARFAVARRPDKGVIKYKRFSGDPDYEINFPALEQQFNWKHCQYFNDLEAAAYGAHILKPEQVQPVIHTTKDAITDNKILVSVGTGVGHAGIQNTSILPTAGGHYLPITVTNEHRKLESFIRNKKDKNLSLIMEDFVSSRGLRMIGEFTSDKPNDDQNNEEFLHGLKSNPDAVRLFFEFFGMHIHNLVSVFGFYGGVYIAGGVVDHLIKNKLTDWGAFDTYFKPSMVSSVNDRLCGCSVDYVLHDELPLLGLTTL
jgi:glucokinase